MFTKEFGRNLVNILTATGLVVVVILIGFYFGYRYRDSQIQVTGDNYIKTTLEEQQSNSKTVQAESVPGVLFIKVNQERTCPDTHPIKGTFDPNLGYFYTKQNKNYDRVKPDICFASEDFAQNTAGFVKKF